MTTLIAPSLLSADFGHLQQEVDAITRAGADALHIDVMDGHFVPNITLGPLIVAALAGKTSLPLDVHLMISDPAKYVPAFLKAGANWLGIHIETAAQPQALLELIKEHGVRPYLVLNPNTPLANLEPFLNEVPMVLFMSVFPGFGGQTFMPSVLPKISELRHRYPAIIISIDGGINAQTAPLARQAGADILVAGSFVFGHRDYQQAITALKSPTA